MTDETARLRARVANLHDQIACLRDVLQRGMEVMEVRRRATDLFLEAGGAELEQLLPNAVAALRTAWQLPMTQHLSAVIAEQITGQEVS